MAAVSTEWVLLSLAPAPPERVRAWFDGTPGLDVGVPAMRSLTAAGVESVVSGVDPVVRRRTPR